MYPLICGCRYQVTHAVEKDATGFGWVSCGSEGELCSCKSKEVRFGDAEADAWVNAERWEPSSRCVASSFKNQDPSPGKVKSCQCHSTIAFCKDGRPVDLARCSGNGEETCRAGCDRNFGLQKAFADQSSSRPSEPRSQLCVGERTFELLWTCNRKRSRVPLGSHPHQEAQEVLDRSMAQLCADPSLDGQLSVFLDCEFLENYLRWTSDGSEWLEEAYVTYVGGSKDSKYEWQATNLVRSISLFSTRPVVVMVFGDEFVPPLSWRELPNVLVYRMLPITPRVSFNFNKIRAMIGARAVVGIQLDTDQIIAPGMDSVFNGTRREITDRYPWPMLPVHWMSRDRYPGNGYEAYVFDLYKEKHTMRWNHAHPTWTFWAVAFLCDLLLERYMGRSGSGQAIKAWKLQDVSRGGLMSILRAGGTSQESRAGNYQGWMIEDEDMLNVNLWRDGAAKAWCKFDLEPSLFLTRPFLQKNMYFDPQWYPDGVPLVFFSSHNTKNFESTDWLLTLLTQCTE
mmetsp:Transcript_149578/g.479476  ORF Transcript_149578/g.479476 Transcript_149578/m.479476 type:complete len:511 (+) Transcript_149578:302-1834(+)